MKRYEICQEINSLKKKLIETDFKVHEFVDGYITEEEYAPIRSQRNEWRDRINLLQSQLKTS